MNNIENTSIIEDVRNCWIKVLDTDKFDSDTSFFEAGGTSLQAVELHQLINEIFPNQISLIDLFELTTVNKIANYIIEKNICLSDQDDIIEI